MPQFIPMVIAFIGTVAGTSQLIIGMVMLATSVAIGSHQQRRANKNARNTYNAAQVDRLANVVTTVAPRELVLGRVRKGGAVYFRGAAGQYNATFMAHLTLAAHEIDAVEAVYLNDRQVTLDGDGWVLTAPYFQTRRVTPSLRYTGPGTFVLPDVPEDPTFTCYILGTNEVAAHTRVGATLTLTYNGPVHVIYQASRDFRYARIRWDLGAGTASADARTQELFPDLWTASHRGQGVAKLIAEFTYEENAFPSSIPNVTALVRGAKVYDPRSGLTAWSDNPALLARHVYQHAHFGKATVSAAEDARFATAANACDTSQAWLVNGGTTIAALYRASLVAAYGAPARELLDDLCQAMAGMWAFAGGDLYIRAGVYTAPVLTLTDADLAVIQRQGEGEEQEPVSIAPHRERAQKFNVVNARIWDAGQDYKQVALSPVKGAALIARDGEELAQEITLSAVGYAPQAQHIAGIMMRDARDPLVFEATFKLRAWPLEIFDTVNVTLDRYGWVSKTFVVLQRVWDRAKGTVRLTLKETAAAIFTPDASFLPQGYADNTALPSPWTIAPPGTLTLTSGTSELLRQSDGTIVTRVRVAWPAIEDQRISQSGQVEIQWALAGQGTLTWQSVLADGALTNTHLTGVTDGQVLLVRARARNSIASSDWGIQVQHQVVGKTELPPNVANFSIQGRSLSWPAVDALDLAGYQVRFNYGTNTDWGIATPLHIGVITESPWTPELFPPGQVTLLVKAQDTTGNQSANAASIVANLGDVILENLVLTYNDKAAGFPGEKTGCTVVAGDLLADDSGILFWGDDEARFWGTDTSLVWPTATYLALMYVTGYTVLATEAGSRLTLSATVGGASYTIEYRYDTQGLAWGDDANYFWPADASLFWSQPTEWQTWPGAIEEVPEGLLQLRITAQAGTVRGSVTALAMLFDVEDENEEFNDVAISAAGTRLPITKSYRAISNVQLTLQDDGGSAVSAQWVDKNATLGPLVQCINSAGTSVTGVLDARIQGVKG